MDDSISVQLRCLISLKYASYLALAGLQFTWPTSIKSEWEIHLPSWRNRRWYSLLYCISSRFISQFSVFCQSEKQYADLSTLLYNSRSIHMNSSATDGLFYFYSKCTRDNVIFFWHTACGVTERMGGNIHDLKAISSGWQIELPICAPGEGIDYSIIFEREWFLNFNFLPIKTNILIFSGKGKASSDGNLNYSLIDPSLYWWQNQNRRHPACQGGAQFHHQLSFCSHNCSIAA